MTIKECKFAIARTKKLIKSFEERVAYYTEAVREEPDNLIFEDNLRDLIGTLHKLIVDLKMLQQELSRLEN